MTRTTFHDANGSREFALYRPASPPAPGAERSLVVMLHGCTQDAADFARGTRMNAVADARGFLVLYPEQPASAHPQKCWNWYSADHVKRDRGEVAILAALIDSIASAEGVSAAHVGVVGMSAGAAMAANLATAYPERVAALAMHSGIAALAAMDVATALHVMREGDGDGAALGATVLAAMGTRARAIPVIALHGSADKIVSPKNLGVVAKQWSVVNGTRAAVEEHLLDGVGHAWSGGSAEGSFTAPGGPDATGLIVDFLSRLKVLAR